MTGRSCRRRKAGCEPARASRSHESVLPRGMPSSRRARRPRPQPVPADAAHHRRHGDSASRDVCGGKDRGGQAVAGRREGSPWILDRPDPGSQGAPARRGESCQPPLRRDNRLPGPDRRPDIAGVAGDQHPDRQASPRCPHRDVPGSAEVWQRAGRGPGTVLPRARALSHDLPHLPHLVRRRPRHDHHGEVSRDPVPWSSAAVRVTVVGGGIGGLTAALSLGAAGIEVRVLEAARRLEPLGVGINLLPPAVRELVELGLGAALAGVGIPTAELVYHDRFGSRIWSEPRGVGAGYRWPQYSIHRGDLQMLLVAAVRERLGGDAVRTGTVFEGFRQDGDEVHLELRDRSTGSRSAMSSDVLVGADGIHSAVRRQLHPEEGAPAVFEYPMVDRDPLPSWSAGRVTLLGDAAHPMYPIGSNGASQAVIDGRVLAWELARHEHPVQALAAYDAARREATAALVLANRQMGPEKVLRIVSERAPDGFDSVEDVMSAAELAAIARDYKLTAGFEVDALNERPS